MEDLVLSNNPTKIESLNLALNIQGNLLPLLNEDSPDYRANKDKGYFQEEELPVFRDSFLEEL